MIPPARTNRNAAPVHDSSSRVRTRRARRGPNRLQRYWHAHKQWYTDNIDVGLLREYIRRGGLEAVLVQARCGSNGSIQPLYPAWVRPDLDQLGNAYEPTTDAPPSVTVKVNTAVALTQILEHSSHYGFPPFPVSHTLFPAIPLSTCPEIEDIPGTGTTAPIDPAQLGTNIERRFPPNVALSPYRHHPHQIYTHGQPIPGALVNAPPIIDASLPSWTFSHKLWGQNENHIQVWSRQPANREIVIKHIRYQERTSWDAPNRWFWIATPTAEDPDAGTQTEWLAEAYFMYRLSACNSILRYYGSGYNDATGIARIGMQCADFGELNFLCERRSLTLRSSRYEAAFEQILDDCDNVDTTARWAELRAAEDDRGMTSKIPEYEDDLPDPADWQEVLRHLVNHTNVGVRDSMRDLIRSTVIPESFIWHTFRSLAQALVALEQQQLIHRDIKPNNIVFTTLTHPTEITENGGWVYKALLADLGEAVHLQDLRPVGPAGATWQSPEAHRATDQVSIVVANTLTYKSDLWDVASIIWYMMDPHLCNDGLAVYDPPNDQWWHVQEKRIHQDEDEEEEEDEEEGVGGLFHLQPRLLIQNLYSNDLKNLVLECLEENPNDRPTAQQLLNRIDNAITNGLVPDAPADGGLAEFADLTCANCHKHEKMCKCTCGTCGLPFPECTCVCQGKGCGNGVLRFACNCPA